MVNFGILKCLRKLECVVTCVNYRTSMKYVSRVSDSVRRSHVFLGHFTKFCGMFLNNVSTVFEMWRKLNWLICRIKTVIKWRNSLETVRIFVLANCIKTRKSSCGNPKEGYRRRHNQVVARGGGGLRGEGDTPVPVLAGERGTSVLVLARVVEGTTCSKHLY